MAAEGDDRAGGGGAGEPAGGGGAGGKGGDGSGADPEGGAGDGCVSTGGGGGGGGRSGGTWATAYGDAAMRAAPIDRAAARRARSRVLMTNAPEREVLPIDRTQQWCAPERPLRNTKEQTNKRRRAANRRSRAVQLRTIARDAKEHTVHTSGTHGRPSDRYRGGWWFGTRPRMADLMPGEPGPSHGPAAAYLRGMFLDLVPT